MNIEDILHALKEKKINPEQAKKELIKLKKIPDNFLSKKSKEVINKTDCVEPAKSKIAIIGMSGQFPEAETLEEFWENLAGGVHCVSEIPSSRWPLEEYFNEDPGVAGKSYSKWMGVLKDFDKFDPLFFNISPLEAELMDPQQRLFLENCWHCIENAGLKASSLSSSRCGVFAGCAANDYRILYKQDELGAYNMIGMNTSILSSRIAYFLNLIGPCMSIDTACSSSLVAIAEACNSLILNASNIALAGGVAVLPGPSIHIMTSKMDVISKGDRCYPFDNRADGYIPGEGVGVILLKRLSDAIRDNDTIHGVISGWGVNQDGKTNGITAPSVKSQIQLEKDVYDRFGINPETITYVETHGTGTKLGDPIEVEALIESFRCFTDKNNYCGLGSIKSNIGHLMTASGVAGVIKVLLSIKNKMLPPTINFEKLNEHIILDNSPFYINNHLKPWEVSAGNRRKAAVSSFGFNGTNAHLVIEEYVSDTHTGKRPVTRGIKNFLLFVLSAKNEKQLKIYAKNMKRYIENDGNLELDDIVYTLQTGREEMKYRLAIPTNSRESLLEHLDAFIKDKPGEGIITGRLNEEKGEFRKINNETKTVLKRLIQNKELKQLGELWVDGTEIDWKKLYGAVQPQRINLPGYPFLKERFWIEKDTSVSLQYIHPLLHENTSSFMEQRYSSVFTGREFFLSDHKVNGKMLLPGAAYLEMAKAAVEAAAEIGKDAEKGIILRNVIWAIPVIVKKKPVKVNVRLVYSENSDIIFEIYSKSEDGNEILHSQGMAEISERKKDVIIDLMSLKGKKWDRMLSSDDCYQAFKGIGIEYGPGHRGIKFLNLSEGEVLAKLDMPSSVIGSTGEYTLHPTMMDSAFQSAIGLINGTNGAGTEVPFAIQEVAIMDKCVSTMWAIVRYSEGRKRRKFDIQLCDNAGKVRVFVKGLELRRIEKDKTVVLQNDPKLTFNEVLLRVQKGELGIEDADRLLDSLPKIR